MRKFPAPILVKDNKILLGKRSPKREYYPNIWDFIGGHCGENEPFTEAMLREVEEEIGVIPKNYQRLTTVENPEFIMKIFLVEGWIGVVQNKQKEEIEKIEWLTLDEALKLDFPNDEYKIFLSSLKF